MLASTVTASVLIGARHGGARSPMPERWGAGHRNSASVTVMEGVEVLTRPSGGVFMPDGGKPGVTGVAMPDWSSVMKRTRCRWACASGI